MISHRNVTCAHHKDWKFQIICSPTNYFIAQPKSEVYDFSHGQCKLVLRQSTDHKITPTKGATLGRRLLIETSNCFYFCPFTNCNTIQKLNKAWHVTVKFHLITQFFRHPQTTVKCPSFVLHFNVFRFSLKEIGNLLGRLAILTIDGFVKCSILEEADRRTSGQNV